MLKKGDIILVCIVIAVIVAWFAGARLLNTNGKDKIAVIKQNGKIIKEIDIDTATKPERIDIPGDFHEVVLVEKGRIRFVEADCPDKVCVKTGWLTDRGDTAACVPNRTTISIQGDKAKVDGVAY